MGEDEVRRVVAAWTDPGPWPEYHRQAQEFLRQRWPVLADALDALARSEAGRGGRLA